MTRSRETPGSSQHGAALVIVLLLVALLSFVVLALASQMARATQRSAASNARVDLSWRAVGVEMMAMSALQNLDAQRNSGVTLTNNHPAFAAGVGIGGSDIGGIVRFVDRSRCFNINSVVTDGERRRNDAAIEELGHILRAAGLGDADAEKLGHVVADWIDEDSAPALSGAEDGFYTNLPTPFRTGGDLLADVSEMRAMDGVTADLFRATAPYLCALPLTAPAKINVNMLEATDAPLLVGLSSGSIDIAAAGSIIASRPAEGWASIDAFWSQEILASLSMSPEEQAARTSVWPERVEVIAQAAANGVELEMSLLTIISPEGGDVKITSREFGAPQ